MDLYLSAMPASQRLRSQQYLAACVFDIVVSRPFTGNYAARLICQGTGTAHQVLARTTSDNSNLDEALAALCDVVAEGLSGRMNGDDVHFLETVTAFRRLLATTTTVWYEYNLHCTWRTRHHKRPLPFHLLQCSGQTGAITRRRAKPTRGELLHTFTLLGTGVVL